MTEAVAEAEAEAEAEPLAVPLAGQVGFVLTLMLLSLHNWTAKSVVATSIVSEGNV